MVEQKPPRPPKNKTATGLRAHALAMLARREYTRRELQQALARYAENPDEIPQLLDDFERRGWLSEQRVVEQVTAARRRRFGARRIVHELRTKGIAEDMIAAAMPALKDTEQEAAREVWRRKFGTVPRNPAERARQVRFLQGRGFALETALRVIGEEADDGG